MQIVWCRTVGRVVLQCYYLSCMFLAYVPFLSFTFSCTCRLDALYSCLLYVVILLRWCQSWWCSTQIVLVAVNDAVGSRSCVVAVFDFIGSRRCVLVAVKDVLVGSRRWFFLGLVLLMHCIVAFFVMLSYSLVMSDLMLQHSNSITRSLFGIPLSLPAFTV